MTLVQQLLLVCLLLSGAGGAAVEDGDGDVATAVATCTVVSTHHRRMGGECVRVAGDRLVCQSARYMDPFPRACTQPHDKCYVRATEHHTHVGECKVLGDRFVCDAGDYLDPYPSDCVA